MVAKATGYSIYNKEQKSRTQINNLEELYPALPNKKYDIIYLDPPWDYGGKMQFDKSSTSADKLDLKKIYLLVLRRSNTQLLN